MGFWLEVVTLVVSGFNDSDAELKAAAHFLVRISPDIPWHLTAFHPDYKKMSVSATPAETLRRAADIAVDAGLRYVYPDLPNCQDTRCGGCGSLIVKRRGYQIIECRIRGTGSCPDCGMTIPGIWSPESLRSSDDIVHVSNRCG